jgi:hypothetical protein
LATGNYNISPFEFSTGAFNGISAAYYWDSGGFQVNTQINGQSYSLGSGFLNPGNWQQLDYVSTNGILQVYTNGVLVKFGADSTNSKFTDLSLGGSSIGLQADSTGGCVCYNNFYDVDTSGSSIGINIINDSGYPFGTNQNNWYGGRESAPIGLFIAGANTDTFYGLDLEQDSTNAAVLEGAGTLLVTPYIEAAGPIYMCGISQTVFGAVGATYCNQPGLGSNGNDSAYGPNGGSNYWNVLTGLNLGGGGTYSPQSQISYNGPVWTGYSATQNGSINSDWNMGKAVPHSGLIATGKTTFGPLANPPDPVLVAVGGTGTASSVYGAVCNDASGGTTLASPTTTTVSGPSSLGAILTATIGDGGSGYALNAIVTIPTYSWSGLSIGDGTAQVKVTSIGTGGVVTGISVYTPGSKYPSIWPLGNGPGALPTTPTGSGSGLTVNITSATYIQISPVTENGCQTWNILKGDTAHQLNAFASGPGNQVYADFGLATVALSTPTRNTTGDETHNGYASFNNLPTDGSVAACFDSANTLSTGCTNGVAYSLNNLTNPTSINLSTLTFAGAAGITAGGTNQSITLTPSGSGGLNIIGSSLQLGSSGAEGNVRWVGNGTNSYLGIYDANYNHSYYGLFPSFPGPTGVAGLGGFYSGMGLGGTTSGTGVPIFGIMNSSQLGGSNGRASAFVVYDNNQVFTNANTLDDGSGNMIASNKMTAAQFCISGNCASSLYSNPMTNEGDLVYYHSSSSARLGIGSNGQCLTSNGTDPLWGSCSTGGGVASFTGDGTFATNSSSTGAVALTLGNAGSNKWWGNNTGSSAAPSYESIGTQDTSPNWYVAGGGTAQAQTVSLSPAVTALTPGLIVVWKPAAANTAAAPTLSVNGLAAKPITKCGTTALLANDIATAEFEIAVYDGTEFQLLNPVTGLCSTSNTIGGIFYSGGSASPPKLSAQGSTNQILLSGGSGSPTWSDFPDVSTYKAATCNNTTAAALWALPTAAAPTVACRTGTNVQAGVLQFAHSNTAQFQLNIPGDYDSTGTVYAKVYLTQGSNTTASQTIIMQMATGCSSTTDDPSFNTAQSFGTATTTSTAQTPFMETLSSITMTGCTAGGNMNVQISRSSSDTATTSPNVYWVSITFPRRPVIQAN